MLLRKNKRYALVAAFTLYLLVTKSFADTNNNPWKGTLSFGLSNASGNTNTITLNSKIGIKRSEGPSIFSSSFSFQYGENESKRNSNKGKGVLKYDHYVLPEIELFGFTTLEYNEFTKLKLRNNTGIGAKYDFIKEKKTDKKNNELSLSLAGVFEYEEIENGTIEKSVALSLRSKNMWTVFDKWKIGVTGFYMPKLSNFSEDYRLTLGAYLKLPMSKNIWFKISFSDEYDNLPPEDVERNDTDFLTSIEINF